MRACSNAQRAPGGRLATRRFAVASFDHGAQYVTATDEASASSSIAPPPRAPPAVGSPHWPGRDRRDDLWVGLPGDELLPRFLAEDLDVEYGARIVRLERNRRGWTLLDDRGAAHTDFTASCSRCRHPRPRHSRAGARRSRPG